MMARRGLLRMLGASVVLPLGGCGMFGGYSYRFKMTVEVEAPSGIITGNGVYEVFAVSTPKLLPEEGARVVEVRGEAIVIDLPAGPVFVLMKPESSKVTGLAEMSMRALDPEFHSMVDSVDSAKRLSGWFADNEGELPTAYWPLMVRFRDLAEPKSVEKVDPQAIGVKRIAVEITRDDVTKGIADRLPWLTQSISFFDTDPQYGRYLPQDKITVAHELRKMDFGSNYGDSLLNPQTPSIQIWG